MKILKNLVLLLILSCSSCARIFFGMKKNKPLSTAAIAKCAHRYGLPDSYILDSNYHRAAKSLPKDKDVAKSLVQPLQFWLYQDDTLVYGMVNCYAYYKFPNLVWPLDSVSAATSPMDIHHYLGYTEHLGLLSGKTDNKMKNKKLIIIWSQFLGRQNRHFLRKVHRYLEKNPSVEVSYYNADNIYINR